MSKTSPRPRTVFIGAAAAILWAPIGAALVAATYRFPVPFRGYVSGFDDVLTAASASVFYLMLGGFLVLGGLGAAAGAAAAKIAARWATLLTLMAAFAVAVLGALSLALLEYVIGPW